MIFGKVFVYLIIRFRLIVSFLETLQARKIARFCRACFVLPKNVKKSQPEPKFTIDDDLRFATIIH